MTSEVCGYRVNTMKPAFLLALANAVYRKCTNFTTDSVRKIHDG